MLHDVGIVCKMADGYQLSDNAGFIYGIEDVEEVAHGLLKYARTHADDIDKHNKETEEYYERLRMPSPRCEKKKTSAYIYMFECGGRYKIGVSKDVKRRIKDLDHRPFKVNLVAQSDFIYDAYGYERDLHEYAEPYRIGGEWYEFDKETAEYFIELINSTEGGE